MPIMDVEVVTRNNTLFPAGIASQLADIAAEICRCKAGDLWVRLRALPVDRYAECGGGPAEGVAPVFVSLLMYRQPPVEDRKRIAEAIATRFAPVLNRPAENIHVLFEPEGRERMAFGGKLVT